MQQGLPGPPRTISPTRLTSTNHPSGTASEHGIDPSGILDFIDALETNPAIEPHGLIILRHGARVGEGYWSPHRPDHRRLVYSLSKTVTGTALGLMIGEGRVALDDLVRDHLPTAFTDTHPVLRELRIRHIASMATGHDHETLGEALKLDSLDPVRGFPKIAPAARPGELFAYNQPPVIALASVLTELAGERIIDHLGPRLFQPFGISDIRSAKLRPGLDLGFSGIYANLDAIARLGQLYLDDGIFQGRRLLPENWVAAASAVQIENTMSEDPD